MPVRIFLVFLFSLWMAQPALNAQSITGEVIDADVKDRLNEVRIENVYNGLSVITNEKGMFNIIAFGGQLLEFTKIGYKSVRVRIPNGYIPPYFKITMHKGVDSRPLYIDNSWHADSMRYASEFKHELDFPKMSTADVMNHPFSALSKQNREIWAFQDQYATTMEQRYVDFNFNPKLVTNMTGLRGDSLTTYMRIYKPTYDQLRSMSEYNFYLYIRHTVDIYRRRGGYSIERNSR